MRDVFSESDSAFDTFNNPFINGVYEMDAVHQIAYFHIVPGVCVTEAIIKWKIMFTLYLLHTFKHVHIPLSISHSVETETKVGSFESKTIGWIHSMAIYGSCKFNDTSTLKFYCFRMSRYFFSPRLSRLCALHFRNNENKHLRVPAAFSRKMNAIYKLKLI